MSIFNVLSKIVLPLALTMATQAGAAVVSGSVTGGQSTGGFTQLNGGGFKVGKNNFQKDELFAFDELQGVTLGADLNVKGGIIAAGTTINSHYVFYDPKPLTRIKGEVSFSSEIIGIITGRGNLIDSNFLGDPTVTYKTPRLVGLEGPGDRYAFTGDTLILDWRAGNPGDHVRVLTAATPVPLPAGALLLASGLAALGLGRRRA